MLLSTRHQIQTRQLNSSDPIYSDAVAKFNNYSVHSGGYISPHIILSDKGIDPERVNSSGPMMTSFAFTSLKHLICKYQTMRNNKERSGMNDDDAWNFCQGDTDLLYFHLWIVSLNDPQLQQFCTEGNQLYYYDRDSADTGHNNNLVSPTETQTPLSDSKKSKRQNDRSDHNDLMRENQIRRKYEFDEECRFRKEECQLRKEECQLRKQESQLRKETSALKKVVELTALLEMLASKPGGKETENYLRIQTIHAKALATLEELA
jgi:hypothetical protein